MPTAFASCRCLTPRHNSVSSPRSSNRTCGATASGFPTDFFVKLTAVQSVAGVRDAAIRVLHRQCQLRTDGCRALPLCAVARGSRARAHRHTDQRPGAPADTFHRRSNRTSRAEICSACRPLRAMDRDCRVPTVCEPSLSLEQHGKTFQHLFFHFTKVFNCSA